MIIPNNIDKILSGFVKMTAQLEAFSDKRATDAALAAEAINIAKQNLEKANKDVARAGQITANIKELLAED